MVLLQDLISCQLHKWYPIFHQHTIPTQFHSLPKSYLSYLQGLSQNGSHSPPPFLLPNPDSLFPDFNSRISADSDSLFPDSDSRISISNPNSRISNPDSNSQILIPDSNSRISKPDSNSRISKPGSDSPISKPDSHSRILNVDSNSRILNTDSHSRILNADSDSGILGSDSESETEVEIPDFPELEVEIRESISRLGGKVVPKLNWSAPKDATWISPIGSLKCESFSEISLLLHSSDCVIHDLTEALSSCEDFGKESKNESEFEFFLGLRKWIPGLRPESEFRCFVRDKNLIGISQREVTAFYPSLLTQKDQIVNSISDFFEEVIKPKFGPKNYTFDVYMTKKGRVILVDFNPWGGFTLPLLFDWDEFDKKENENEEIELRIVEDYLGVRPGIKTAVPYDYLDTSQGSGWDQFFRNAEVEIRRQMKMED